MPNIPINPSEQDKTRFWKYVTKTDGCWLWTGASDVHGYGAFRVDKRNIKAHRFAYAICVESVRDGMHVCHKCDTPSCVCPDHLFQGTTQDNSDDMVSKGRGNGPRRGVTHCLLAGHPLSGDNLIIYPSGARRCRTCRLISNKVDTIKRRERRRAQKLSNLERTCPACGSVFMLTNLNGGRPSVYCSLRCRPSWDEARLARLEAHHAGT